ncbi:tail fiber assembly protein [Enterobacter asburiae]|uniref:tail fiber assembly protein n=1 Tax=Enterobacter asburiae TaxID=61645 RepID=UPI001F2460E5|nr:tail fiber assembly protein [Enterobacter asburiae]MCF1338724.1 tail fiber assembly protein [Enterobacter asburiae]MCQ4337105.1 tail fiber assembly protein [Enterobacter asburiae]HDC4532635.1 tail fiber assembly protein [Enterobacter asburiae]
MDTFINPVIYKYEHVEINGVMRTGLYFQDIHGRDWYETLRDWKGAIATDAAGIVIACETDVTLMGMMEGRNVYEVDPEHIPENVIGNYTFQDGFFTDIRPDAIELAEQKRKELLEEAKIAIAPLQDASDLGIETDEERGLLNEWKKYRVLLNRIDTSNAPDIDWPPGPMNN